MNIAICVGVLLGTLSFCSIFEWVMHKYFMHKRWRWLPQPYDRHAIAHHQSHGRNHFFDEEAWNSAIIFLLPFVTLAAIGVGYLTNILIGITVGITTVSYVLAYELMHYSFHNPKWTWYLRFRWMCYRLECHRLHHLDDSKNYNVVLPWADRLRRTLSLDILPTDNSAPIDRRFRGPIDALNP
jgi:hypothetical protein